jgi:hypothetical protein
MNFLQALQPLRRSRSIAYLACDSPDPDTSLLNLQLMESNGFTPIPVYHTTDFVTGRTKILEEYSHLYPVIAIGGVMSVNLSTARECLNYAFSVTQDRVPLHGVGVGRRSIMDRYPFHSVSTNAQLRFAKYGRSRKIKDRQWQKYLSQTKDWTDLVRMETSHLVDENRKLTNLWRQRGVSWQDGLSPYLSKSQSSDLSRLPGIQNQLKMMKQFAN